MQGTFTEVGAYVGRLMDKLSDNLRAMGNDLTSDAALSTKNALLDALQARVPTMGFSRHDEPGGRRFFVRYNLHTLQEDPFYAIWAVPPGPYIVEGGAQPHDITTTWGRGGALRTIRHPGVPARPFWDDTVSSQAQRVESMVQTRFDHAIEQSLAEAA